MAKKNDGDLIIDFNGTKRIEWLNVVSQYFDLPVNTKQTTVYVNLNDIDNIDELEPIHLVLLACFRQSLNDKGYKNCYLATDNQALSKFLFEDINLGQYWLGKKPENHTESSDETIFNLWRVIDTEKEDYSDKVHRYLKRKFFQYKDLSSVKLSLLEIFYNIFDHAEAKGNAFSLVKYNRQNQKLYVAVCDFGKGIATTIKSYYKNITTDKEAILMATESTVSTKSKSHNMGMGIGNVIDNLGDNDILRIVSNSGFLYVTSGIKKTFQLKNDFRGTLIYYEISLSNFDDEEIIDNFDFSDYNDI